MRRCLLGTFFAFALFSSCGEDDIVMPSYRQDLAELSTNVDGRATLLSFDDGRILKIDNNVSGLVPDTLYRILALYVEVQGGANLHAAQTVFSPYPVNRGTLETQSDPIEIKAMWSSKRYINLLVGLKTGGGKQTLDFIDEGIEVFPNGVQKLKLQLFHDQMEDTPYYTQDTYLSCPIYQYHKDLVTGRDSVEMTVLTLDGIQTKSFPY